MIRTRLLLKTAAALCLWMLLGSGNRLQAQLVAGDIAFTGYNSVNNGYTSSDFSFVLLRALDPNTQIIFTDVGYNPSTTPNLISVSSDRFITWTAPAGGLPILTEVTIKVNYNAATDPGLTIKSVSHGTASAPYAEPGGVGTGFILNGAGDQIFALQGSLSNPTYIAGIHMNAEGANSTLTDWDLVPTNVTYNTTRSRIPSTLTNGVNAVMVVTGTSPGFQEYDYARYNCTGATTSATIADLRAAINNRDNWVANNTSGGWYDPVGGCTFSLAAAPSFNSQPASSTVCAGSNATFSVTTSNVTSYQWQVNTGSGFADITSSTGGYSGYTTATLTITGVPASYNGYQYRVRATGTSSINSNAATLTVSIPGSTWLGTTNTLWSTASNWTCNTLPTSTTNVTIPSGTPNSPVIDITNAEVANLTIASGATLSFTGSGNAINVYGTLTPTGTFNTANGKVAFAGTAQIIPALTYQNLQMTGGGSKTLAGATTVNGTLTLTSGWIVLGSNNLTIGSTGSITGQNINSFVVASGSGGLFQNNIGAGGRTGTIVFPVGISTSSYTPFYLNNTSGTADNFKGRVINNVYSSYDASDNPTGSIYNSREVTRTWLITEGTAGGSNATLTLQWNSGDQASSFDINNCFVSHYIVANSKWVQASTAAAAGGFDPYTISASGINSFSPFGVGSIGSPLPLRLISFNARKAGKNVSLEWNVADEKDMQDYAVERSADGVNFNAAGSVKAHNMGAQVSSYTYTDLGAGEGAKAYYRLRMQELNGSFKYSPVVSLSGEGTGPRFTVHPNPVSGDVIYVRATGSTGDLSIVIRDVSGRKVYETTVSATQAGTGSVPLGVKLPAGTYLMQVSDKTATEQVRFVQQ